MMFSLFTYFNPRLDSAILNGFMGIFFRRLMPQYLNYLAVSAFVIRDILLALLLDINGKHKRKLQSH